MRKLDRSADYDWWLLGLSGLLALLGLLEIYSATRHTTLHGMVERQLCWIGLGVLLLWLLSRVDYELLLERAPVLYGLMLAGLALVLAIGHTRMGARRWVHVAGIPVQVSEFAKLAIIIVLARFLAGVRTDRLSLRDWAAVLGLVGLPAGLILLQPDLGTALTLLPVALVGAFLAGWRWKHVLVLALCGGLAFPLAWHYVLRPYQKARLVSFLRPEEDPQGSGYQILQSQIAIGSGGLWGKGWGRGSQNQLGFVPVRYSDFILAALAEELGFMGVLLTLVLYAGLLLRLVMNAQQARDRAGMYIVAGVAAILGFHVFVNAAMVIGWMPVTGIPLPLLSYGGSATLFVFMALGLVMSVRLGRFVN
jgi:rod shape determining protein RodA